MIAQPVFTAGGWGGGGEEGGGCSPFDMSGWQEVVELVCKRGGRGAVAETAERVKIPWMRATVLALGWHAPPSPSPAAAGTSPEIPSSIAAAQQAHAIALRCQCRAAIAVIPLQSPVQRARAGPRRAGVAAPRLKRQPR